MNNIAIFASGSGTNAENIIGYFSNEKEATVKLVLTNNPKAMVLKRAEKHSVETYIFDRAMLYSTGEVLKVLEEKSIDYIILAGFLWLVPPDIITAFDGRIVNIHPALLPRYGGKGMYGSRVHEAVIASGDRESGITIHYVNEKYDDGDIIFQAKCNVEDGDTAETLAAKVHELEYRFFPEVVHKLLKKLPEKT